LKDLTLAVRSVAAKGISMTTELYEIVRRNLFGDHNQHALVQLLKDREG